MKYSRYLYAFFLVSLEMLVFSCENEADPTKQVPPIEPFTSVTNIEVEDVGDAGNGSDILVRFDRIDNESNILGYAIIVVQDDGEGFDFFEADDVPDDNLTFIAKNGADVEIRLNVGATDSRGTPISNGIDYTVFIVSASGIGKGSGALSVGTPIRLE